jgi:hypothetical protein
LAQTSRQEEIPLPVDLDLQENVQNWRSSGTDELTLLATLLRAID